MTAIQIVFIACVFIAIYLIHEFQHEYAEKHMPCDSEQKTSEGEAITDWDNFENHDKDLKGTLNCFCNQLKSEIGFFRHLFKSFTTPSGEARICWTEFGNDIVVFLVGISLTLFVVLMDEVIEIVSDILLEWIGFHSNSELVKTKKNVVFALTFT